MNRIKIISVYIGKLPLYFDTVKKTMIANKTVDWTIYTDNVVEQVLDENVALIPYSMEQYNSRLSELFSKKVSLRRPYKIADTKPLYALAFPDQVSGYDWWGFCDLDVIFGNIRSFLTEEILNTSEVITYIMNSTLHGPFSIFKNRTDIINSALEVDYKFDDDYCGADEIEFYKIIKSKGFKIKTCIYTDNGKEVNFIRYGKRRTPARWVNGELLLDTYLEDYNHTKFGPYTNQTMMIHVRKDYVIKNGVIYVPRVDGDIFQIEEKIVINECKYHTNKIINIDDVCVINVTNSIGNYYHVITEFIPSILSYIRNRKINKINLFFGDFTYPDSINILKEVIHYMFGSYPNIINQSCSNIKNLKLVKPTIINHVKSLNGMSKIDFEDIRIKILSNKVNLKKVNRIIVKRSNRYISSEIIHYLVEVHGFKELEMERFNIAEQAFLFNNADIILGTHGAGLTNMLFCKNNATVIEVNAGYNCGCYPHLRDELLYKTENLNINLYSIFGDSTHSVLKNIEIPPNHIITRYRELDKFVKDAMRFNYVYKTSPNEYSYIPRIGFKEISKNDDVILDFNRFKNTIDTIISSI